MQTISQLKLLADDIRLLFGDGASRALSTDDLKGLAAMHMIHYQTVRVVMLDMTEPTDERLRRLQDQFRSPRTYPAGLAGLAIDS